MIVNINKATEALNTMFNCKKIIKKVYFNFPFFILINKKFIKIILKKKIQK
jgi:hypothetical protein